jgi:hypothetical protein
MLALLQSEPGFSFILGAVAVIVVAVVSLFLLGLLVEWAPDLIYWLVKRRERRNEGEQTPLRLRQRNSRHDENA